MVVKVFSVYDSKAEAFLRPMFLQSKGLALRSFIEAIHDKGHDFSKYAGDFTLFEIGEFDDNKGEIVCYSVKVKLGCAIEFLESNGNSKSGERVTTVLPQKKETLNLGEVQ